MSKQQNNRELVRIHSKCPTFSRSDEKKKKQKHCVYKNIFEQRNVSCFSYLRGMQKRSRPDPFPQICQISDFAGMEIDRLYGQAGKLSTFLVKCKSVPHC